MFLAAWEIISRAVGHEIIIPSLFLIVKEIIHILSSPELYNVILHTVMRIVLTFLIDFFLAVIIGIPAGLYKVMEELIRPLESAIRAVPTMGVILLALIWMESEIAPVFVTSLIIFPILYRSTVDSIHNLDRKLIEFHNVHHIPFSKKLRCFYIPAIFPFIRSSSVSALGLGFKVMITAEVLSQPKIAIGTIFQIERSQFNTAGVMAWCIIIISISSILERTISLRSRSFKITKKGQV